VAIALSCRIGPTSQIDTATKRLAPTLLTCRIGCHRHFPTCRCAPDSHLLPANAIKFGDHQRLLQQAIAPRSAGASFGIHLLIAAIVPAHNEADYIGACVRCLKIASRCRRLNGEAVNVVVVLDDCNDATDAIAREAGALVLRVRARNVGTARAAGAEFALDAGARWLAFTDADSVVAPEWLADQLDLHSDVVCGTVAVRDWGVYGAQMQQHYKRSYTDADGHRHIHGANLGVSAAAYRRAGGFKSLTSSEDVALVEALRNTGAHIAWSARPRVETSARKTFRAPLGFGATLLRIDQESRIVASDELL